MESKSRKMKFADLKDMLKQTGEVYGNRPAYIFKDNGSMKTISHKEFRDEINALGTVLINMGLKDKRIAVISENRYEWELSYLAIAAGVGVVVPLDKALPDNELESLILRSQVEAIFYSSKYDTIMNTLREKKNTNLKYFISMDLQENTNGIYSQKALQEKGKKLLEEGNKQYLDAKIDADKMGIMLFTSGTTAMSKAVMLSHKNLVTNVMDIIQRFDLTEEDRFLSFLPLHHTLACLASFLFCYFIGFRLCFADSIKDIGKNLVEYKISGLVCVPAVLEIMYKQIMRGIKKSGKYIPFKILSAISNFLLFFHIDLRRKFFKDILDNLGGNMRTIIYGSASSNKKVIHLFNTIGIVMIQGYGLTETSPVIACENDIYHSEKGSSGFPLYLILPSFIRYI